MAVQIQTRRSSTANDRPFPVRLGAGELALNNNSVSPGLFFADNVLISSIAFDMVAKSSLKVIMRTASS